MHERLKVDYAGLELENPLVLGSGPPGWDGESLRKAALAGAGAVVSKTIGPPERFARHPRCGRVRLARLEGSARAYGMINLELYTTMSTSEWIERELPIAATGKSKVIASIVAQADPIPGAEVALELEATGCVDMFEINVSCPMPDVTVGYLLGQDPKSVAAQVKAFRQRVHLPVSVKLTPTIGDIVPIARAAEDEGADALVVANSVRSFAGVDIEQGKPFLPAYGGYSGPAIKPITQRFVSEVARAVQIPICALGGVRTWKDIVEYIMLGATTVGVVTTVMWEGYEAIGLLLNGLQGFMERKGYDSLCEMRRIALPYITTIDQYASNPPLFISIDQQKCNDCQKCLSVCFYGALYSDGHLQARRERCDGCGLCVEICPKGALRLTAW